MRPLRAAAARYGTDGVLLGTLEVYAMGYWTTQWSLNWNGVDRRWRLDRVTSLAPGLPMTES